MRQSKDWLKTRCCQSSAYPCLLPKIYAESRFRVLARLKIDKPFKEERIGLLLVSAISCLISMALGMKTHALFHNTGKTIVDLASHQILACYF